MSSEYLTSFAAVPLTRAQVLDRVTEHLTAAGMRFFGEAARLDWDDVDRTFTYAYDEGVHRDLREALERTAHWPGVMLEHDAPTGDRSVHLWDDPAGSGQVLGVEDPSGSFYRLWEPEARPAFLRFVVDLAHVLDAPFAVTAHHLPLRPVTAVALRELLADLPADDERARPAVVVVHDHLDLGDAARRGLSRHHRAERVQGCAEPVEGRTERVGSYTVHTDTRPL